MATPDPTDSDRDVGIFAGIMITIGIVTGFLIWAFS